MNSTNAIQKLDGKLIEVSNKFSWSMLRVSIGAIYIVFGLLKFIPNYSPAEGLASRTIELLTFQMITGNHALISLAVIETAIGALLVMNLWTRGALLVALWHMVCTFSPIFLLPGEFFVQDPVSLSLVGQYILKNFVIIAALLLLYGQQRRVNTGQPDTASQNG